MESNSPTSAAPSCDPTEDETIEDCKNAAGDDAVPVDQEQCKNSDSEVSATSEEASTVTDSSTDESKKEDGSPQDAKTDDPLVWQSLRKVICDSKSSDDSDTDEEIEENVKNKEKYDPTPKLPRPKHKWSAIRSFMNRQQGSSVCYSPHYFRYDCYGSLHMVERLELMYKMKKHEGCVNALNFNAKGTKLVSGSDDLDIVVWDWTVSEPIVQYSSGHGSNVFQSKFMPLTDDCEIMSAARDGQIRNAHISPSGEFKGTRLLAQHKGAAHKIAMQSNSSDTFLSCGADAAVFEIDLRKEKPGSKIVVCREDTKRVPLYSIHINPIQTHEFIVTGCDQFVRVYDRRFVREDERVLKKFCPQHLVESNFRPNVTAAVFSYNGKEIVASYNDEDVYLFDSQASDMTQFLHRYKGHRNSQTVKGVNFFGSKSEFIVSGSDCGHIFFWDKESEHIVKFMRGDENGVVNCLEPHPNMPVLATSGLDDDIKIWVPSCENPPDLSGLKSHVISNMMAQEEDRNSDAGGPDLDERMLWLLMQQIRRARRETQSDVVFVGDANSSSGSDTDDDQYVEYVSQCSQS